MRVAALPGVRLILRDAGADRVDGAAHRGRLHRAGVQGAARDGRAAFMVKPLPAFALDKAPLKRSCVRSRGSWAAQRRSCIKHGGHPAVLQGQPESLRPGRQRSSHSEMGEPDLLKHEYDFAGCHAGDLAVGNSARGAFCFIEFEDASRHSVFKAPRKGRLPESVGPPGARPQPDRGLVLHPGGDEAQRPVPLGVRLVLGKLPRRARRGATRVPR